MRKFTPPISKPEHLHQSPAESHPIGIRQNRVACKKKCEVCCNPDRVFLLRPHLSYLSVCVPKSGCHRAMYSVEQRQFLLPLLRTPYLSFELKQWSTNLTHGVFQGFCICFQAGWRVAHPLAKVGKLAEKGLSLGLRDVSDRR